MEENINFMQVNTSNTNSLGGFNLQSPIRVHQPQFTSHNNTHNRSSPILQPTIPENFPLTITHNQDPQPHISIPDYNKDSRKSTSDEDEPCIHEDSRGKKSSSSSPWQRVKWTDSMVKLLITAVSYISEETSFDGSRRKFVNLQKKGKWKSVSKVMAERGHMVSPQQCEDKFNDLNKRYKRLNEILGRGTSCEVVENPTLLDIMDHVSDKAKDEVRKILSSKHLHYEEMCSYHNGNRLHLPPDPELQHSLRLALKSREDYEDDDLKKHSISISNEENDDIDDQEGEFEDHVEYEENVAKRAKRTLRLEEFSFNNYLGCDGGVDISSSDGKRNRLVGHRSIKLEEQRLHIEEQMLELEREKFKWQRFCYKKDKELEGTRMEIEKMRLENEKMALELRRKEMGLDDN